LVLVRDGEGVHGAAPGRDEVLDLVREARDAERARPVLDGAAGTAALQPQLAARRALEVGARLPVRARRGMADRLGHQSRPSTRVAPLCATPSVPPVPCASARRAPSTWRGPHSPRSCCTASITRKMPRIPGW